jgi:hypothetical protein
MLLDWLCAKIETVVRSSFEAEINSAQASLDQMEFVNCMLTLILRGCTLRDYRQSTDRHESDLVGDNKGLYSAAEAANPITTKGEKRLTIDKMLMKDHLRDFKVKYRWTNAGQQLADGLTKLSSEGARIDMICDVLEQGYLRITYSEVSGRKETAAKYSKKAVPEESPEADQMFALDTDDRDEAPPEPREADSWDEYFLDQ